MRLLINNLYQRAAWKARAWINDWRLHNHSWTPYPEHANIQK